MILYQTPNLSTTLAVKRLNLTIIQNKRQNCSYSSMRGATAPFRALATFERCLHSSLPPPRTPNIYNASLCTRPPVFILVFQLILWKFPLKTFFWDPSSLPF